MIRLTVRATDDSVPAILAKAMQEHLSMGLLNGPEEEAQPSMAQISDAFSNVMVS
jgi:AP-2 complex subunit alpha